MSSWLNGLLAVAGSMALGIVAQTEKPVAFEVVSIRPFVSSRPGLFFARAAPLSVADGISGNRLRLAAVNLADLIAAAYDVQKFQISRVPSWAGPAQYNIEAKGEGEAPLTLANVRLMLQSMLADRFQLKLRRGTKELAVYELVVGANGSKLKAVSPGDKLPTGASGAHVTRQPLSHLVSLIGTALDRPVIDQTGLPNVMYEFSLDLKELIQEVEIVGRPAPSIFGMVQDQLGLKLESKKGSVDILVIDDAARPSAN